MSDSWGPAPGEGQPPGPPPGMTPGYGAGGYPPPGYGAYPGYGGYAMAPGPKPDNYLVWAILSTLFCCLPFGIAAIVYASQVDSKWSTGDWAGAMDSSKKAKMWAMIGAGGAAAAWILYLLFFVVLVGLGSSTSGS